MFVPRTLHQSTKSGPMALSLVLFFALTPISCALRTVQGTDPGIKIRNFGRINENYYRGGQVKQVDFAALTTLGIKTVIDLQEDGSEKESGWARFADMKYYQIPLSTSRPATEEQTEYFLKLVNDPANWPVYVHCAAGRHRTGAMTAIYRITRDSWTADQAFAEMKRYGFYSFPNHGPLKDFVYRYYENRAKTVNEAVLNQSDTHSVMETAPEPVPLP